MRHYLIVSACVAILSVLPGNARADDSGGANDLTTLTQFLPGDANEDGTVNNADLTIVLENYNQSGKSWTDGDFIGTGTVNGVDLNIVLSNFGKSSEVPEPAGLALFGVGAVGLSAYLWRRSRNARRHRVV